MIHYEKWIFIADFTDEDGTSFGELINPLEKICDQFLAHWNWTEIDNKNFEYFVKMYSLEVKKKNCRGKELVEKVSIEHDIRLPSRSRSTTVINVEGFEHEGLLESLHQFYSKYEDYRRLNPDFPTASRMMWL